MCIPNTKSKFISHSQNKTEKLSPIYRPKKSDQKNDMKKAHQWMVKQLVQRETYLEHSLYYS